jgi:hypothetical protein
VFEVVDDVDATVVVVVIVVLVAGAVVDEELMLPFSFNNRLEMSCTFILVSTPKMDEEKAVASIGSCCKFGIFFGLVKRGFLLLVRKLIHILKFLSGP